MKTEIIPAAVGLDRAAELIKSGETVVFPTETVYGLGADAFNDSAVAKIFKAKGRPQDNPLIVHIAEVDEVCEIAKNIPSAFYELASRFMPGPLTIVLPKGDKIPYSVTAGGETVAVRMPDNFYARELIAKSSPLAAPSANKSKHVSPTTAAHVYDDLSGEVPLILDGGACGVGIESTVLDLTAETPTVLRPGAITAEMLAEFLGEVTECGRVIRIAKAPGMKYAHYAPRAEAAAASDITKAVEAYDEALNRGAKPVIVSRDIYRDVVKERALISLGVTAQDYMRNIYSALRAAERAHDFIIVEELTGGGIEASVMNRVLKACGGKRI